MKRNRALIAINLFLLAVLSFVTFGPSATAQNQSNRGRGEYTMVGGGLDNGNSDGVYIIDSANSEMIMLRWDHARSRLNGVGFRDLDDDKDAQPSR